jgi:hypothetical protein
MCDAYEPFTQDGTFRHQILQPYPKFYFYFLISEINDLYLFSQMATPALFWDT